MRYLSLLILLAGCDADINQGGAGLKVGAPAGETGETGLSEPPVAAASTGGTVVEDPCGGLAGCIDAATLPVQWTTGFGGISWLADQDGDGLRDLWVGSTTAAMVYVVATKPIAVPRSDLADAVATSVKGLIATGDATGDAIPDFYRPVDYSIDPAPAREFVAGPIAGDFDALPIAVTADPYTTVEDYDGDGVMDTVTVGGDHAPGGTPWVELHPGPVSAWSAPATLRVETVLAKDEDIDCLDFSIYLSAKDLDGDGRAEQIVNGGFDLECPQQNGYVLPAGATGTWQLTRSGPSAPLDRYLEGYLIPDQDGDGIQDSVYQAVDPLTGTYVNDGARCVYSGPMSPVDGIWQPAGPIIATLPSLGAIQSWTPLWDLDGDGITEWLEIEPRSGSYLDHSDFKVIRGGVDSLVSPVVLGFWTTLAGRQYVAVPEEEALLVQTATGFAVIDLSVF